MKILSAILIAHECIYVLRKIEGFKKSCIKPIDTLPLLCLKMGTQEQDISEIASLAHKVDKPMVNNHD